MNPCTQKADGWKRSYRFTPSDNRQDASGELNFNWAEDHGRGTFYAYNLLTGGQGIFGRQPIEDVRLAATVEPDRWEDFTVEFTTSTRLENQVETVVASFGDDGGVALHRENPSGRVLIASGTAGRPLRSSKATALELWIVDQEILVWVDGEVVLRHAY
ncbi:MAG: hypothetical protein AAGA31_11210, partial [Bacteroidota bacterium]